MNNYKRFFVRLFTLLTILLGIVQVKAQTYVNGPLNQANTTGAYYHNTSIVLAPGFSATGSNGSFQAYINPTLPIPNASSSDRNYVSVWTPRVPVKTIGGLKSYEQDYQSVSVDISYLDELERPFQAVKRNYTPSGDDLIQPIEYDALGRQSTSYLPYAPGDGHSGTYRDNALTGAQAAFYNNGNSLIAQSAYPFSKIIYEASPLERAIEEGKSGDVWQPANNNISNSGHTTRHVYTTNNDIPISDINNTHRAALYLVNIGNDGERTLISNGYYSDNDLFIEIIKSENWSSNDGVIGTTEVYKSKEGKTVLKRSFNKNATGTVEVLSTYYVYDDYGNLCYVLPPGANPDLGTTIPSISLNNFCYQYSYDDQNRVNGKKVPGKGWEYSIYNKLNQLVAVQDGNQLLKKEWSIGKYDGLGRKVISGMWNNSGNSIPPKALQDLIDNLSPSVPLSENRVSSGDGYTVLAWPQSLNQTYSIKYFDDYDVPNLPASFSYQLYNGNPKGFNVQTQSLPTILKTCSMSNPSIELWTVNYFDINGDLIQTQESNQLNGKDIVNRVYDFNKQIITAVRQHSTSITAVNVVSKFVFDHRGRMSKEYNQIGSATEVLLNQAEYNELGQIVDKQIHQRAGSSKFIQSIDYRYNINGWLSSINDITSNNAKVNSDDNNKADVDKFALEIQYQNATIPQYSGNIGALRWKTSAPIGSGLRSPIYGYDFKYDNSNRLIEAVSSISGEGKGKYFDEYIRYDVMGNITSLGRWSRLNTGKVQIDSLSYLYDGNQVNRIDDNSNNNVYGFIELQSGSMVKQPNEFQYDANGNEQIDLNKGISSITYNVFNLPEKISWNDGKTLTYDYDGTGKKLTKTFKVGSDVSTTAYVDGIQYEQGQLAFISTSEGVARKFSSNNSYIYQYGLQDHLGNLRVMLQPNSTTDGLAEIIQISNYYPFGLELQSNESSLIVNYITDVKNNNLYNDKELQIGINEYDYGARLYDPAKARWNVIDNLSDRLEQIDKSPYAYAWNNPVLNTDPDGNCPWCAVAGAVIGGGVNVIAHWNKIVSGGHPLRDGLVAFGIGAAAGAVAGATLNPELYATTTTAIGAISQAAAIGSYASMQGNLIRQVGNHLYFHDDYSLTDFATEAISGGVTGGAMEGLNIAINGLPNPASTNVSAWGAHSGVSSKELAEADAFNLSKTAQARSLGTAGENAVGIVSADKIRIPSLTQTAAYRVPDALTSTSLIEVKNVSRLSLTNQLKDFYLYSQQTGRQFILYVRPNGGTTFTKPLNELIKKGLIITKEIKIP